MRSRYLSNTIQDDAIKAGKMAFISGPRQVGKSTMAKALLTSSEQYFNWDSSRFRRQWVKDPAVAIGDEKSGTIVLDEIHKDRRWKQRLKGVYDVYGSELNIIVTGSARLDFYRRGGDSLMGRYLPYRLHPFSVGEQASPPPPSDFIERSQKPRFAWRDLMAFSGFPEPLLQANVLRAQRWSRLRLDRLVQEDVRDFRSVEDIQALKILVDLLPERVGSLLSINGLREDIGVAYATVREWTQILEVLYHCFLIRPYIGKLNRMVRAERKLYLYDVLQIENPAKRLENLAALHLLKACHYWTDSAMGDFQLFFLRTKDKVEVDFCITKNKKPWMLVECKSNSRSLSPALCRFQEQLKTEWNFQLVSELDYLKHHPRHEIYVGSYDRILSSMV